MNITALSRTGFAVALSAIMASWVAPVQAAEPTGSPLFPSLSLTPGLKDRMFMRMQYIHVNIKTESGGAYDVTGPVIRVGDIANVAGSNALGTLYDSGVPNSTPPIGTVRPDDAPARISRGAYRQAGGALDAVLISKGMTGLGTPDGIKARAEDSAGTPAISLGYYLSDDYSWVVEAVLLGVPLSQKVYGDGVNASGNPNGLNGKHIISTKLLPPTVTLGKYFGDVKARFKPYIGLMAMYAIFYDTKPTAALNDYQGGVSIGDTSVSIKNAFGVGPIVGFKYAVDDDWHVGLNLGQVRLKTKATLVTRNTTITSNSGVIQDYDPEIINAINIGEGLTSVTNPGFGAGFTTKVMESLARVKSLGTSTNLGTFVRKQDTALDNTIFMLSVGRAF